MADETRSRQHQILNLLLNNKGGPSIDEIAATLAISRNAVQHYLHKLACSLAQSLLPKFEGRQSKERLAELVKLMNELGFHAKVMEESASGRETIQAINCIYHDLAQKNEEICEFDRALITTLLGKEINQAECMAKGGSVCSFQIREQLR